jgi:hypothetical protein
LNYDNSTRFGLPSSPAGSLEATSRELNDQDKLVAERQVAQLQRAQAVAVARLSPLRVSLPTRGLRHSFVQVLQTEINKPLTITMNAANDRKMGWFKKASLWSGGFVCLWVIAAVFVTRRPVGGTHPAPTHLNL